VLFAAVSVIWGIPYLFIKVAVDDGVPPAFLAWARVVIGALVLLGLAWQAGLLHGLRPRLRWLAAFAVVEIVGPFPLIAAGEQHVDSGLAAILIAAAPLFVALLALRFDAQESARGSRLIGLVVGLIGVGVLVGVDLSGTNEELLGAAALLCAALGYAVAPLLILKRHLGGLDPRATMGVSLVIAAVLLTPAAAYDPPSTMPPAAALVAIAVLGVVCTAAGLTLYGLLNAEIGPGRAVVITYVNPVVAVGLGMVFLDERPGAGAILGLGMILAGSWLATRPPSVRPDGGDSEGDLEGVEEPIDVVGVGVQVGRDPQGRAPAADDDVLAR
jgi:drug/metabolite transporter (DMT)-like permease